MIQDDEEILFVLALALGKSLQEIMSLSSWELAYWQAYYQKQPFGSFRTDLNAAMVARAFAGGSIDDHMIKFDEPNHNPQAAYAYFISTMKPEDRPRHE